MIEALSPLTRRIVALGLLVLTLLLAMQWLVLPLAGAVWEARSRLSDLRARTARLSAITARPPPAPSTIPEGLAIMAPNAALAGQQLQALVSGHAATAGVTLEAGAAPTSGPASRQLSWEMSASGSEQALTQFVSLVEHGAPAVRFRRWRIGVDDAPGAPQRFTGLATAVWGAKL